MGKSCEFCEAHRGLVDRLVELERVVAALMEHQHHVGDPTGRHAYLPTAGPIGRG